MILALAPETNGQVAVKARQALGEMTGREHTHLAINKEDEKIRFRDIRQPRKIISARPGQDWKASMSLITPDIPTYMN